VQGKAQRFTHPTQAVRLGLAFCPEERKADGIVGELSVRENIVLALQARAGLWPCIRPAKQRELAQRYIELLGIRAADSDMPIALLSGGKSARRAGSVGPGWLSSSMRARPCFIASSAAAPICANACCCNSKPSTQRTRLRSKSSPST